MVWVKKSSNHPRDALGMPPGEIVDEVSLHREYVSALGKVVFFPCFPSYPPFPPFFLPVLGTTEKAGVM